MLPHTARLATYLTAFTILLSTLLAPLGASARAVDEPAAPDAPAITLAQDTGGPLTIPLTKPPLPQIDGKCTEYTDTAGRPFDDGGGKKGTVFIKHDGTNLYVCMQAQPGTFKERFGALYLDPQGDGSSYMFAKADDYSLRVNIPGTTRKSYHGTGVANGYALDSSLDALWTGASTADATGESVEWSVSLGRFKLGLCARFFGIAVYHHWFSAVGDDYGWPSNQFFDQPGTWQLAKLQGVQPCPPAGRLPGRIAYIYRGNTADASSFYNLLVGAGYTVDLIPLGSVLATEFQSATGGPNYDLIIIADDTGDLDSWGLAPPPVGISEAQVNRIKAARIPIMGLGEGGYAFFGKLDLFIGWPNGWHGPQEKTNKAASAPVPYYTGVAADPVQVYSPPVNAVGIYLNPAPLPSDVLPIGLENPTKDHASIIQQGCRLLWGYSGNPNGMAADGKTVFLNAVGYMHRFQCPGEPPKPPKDCLGILKTATPADGTIVEPLDVIKYTITYTMSNAPGCNNGQAGRLIDSVPQDTIFVPGSASDGIAPGADGSLVWVVTPAPGPQTKTFRVLVADTQCHNQRVVYNRAGLFTPGHPPEISNTVKHPVKCPPIVLPNNDPPYAEQEVQIHPYPMYTGVPSKVSVRLNNASATAQQVKVSFQTSPQRFGIGITFNNFDTQIVTIPANGNVIVETYFTPVSSGHYCIQVKIEDNNPNPKYKTIYTQRNLDVNESLRPGVKDDLKFKVANPTTATANINLVVVNTCPGWIVSVSPALLTAVGPNGSDVREAILSVTPPNPVTLGSGCHIDVQGWIGDKLIGGIRKLDVPPVQLPPFYEPGWLEPEISLVPNPPVVGQPSQICVQLQNPTGTPRTVTLQYAVADFGAGIPFTTVGTQVVTLPPFSNALYCIPWTPSTGGTLHRCVQITLMQAGYQNMRSQRNFDLRKPQGSRLDLLDFPFKVRNPDLVPHALELDPTIYGIDPFWEIKFLTDPGDPPPDVLQPGETVNLHMRLVPRTATHTFVMALGAVAPAQAPESYRYGDVSRVDVAVLLDGEQIGGITAELDNWRVLLPLTRR